MQELIEADATERIGTERYERTENRVTERNQSRPRLVSTQASDIELRIPKLRKGSFLPSILEPRRRIDQALYAVVMEAYVNGVSTRSIDDLVAALGVDSGISKSEVSGICAGLDEVVGAFRTRRLDHVEFSYVYLDATHLHVPNGGQPRSKPMVDLASERRGECGRRVGDRLVGDVDGAAHREKGVDRALVARVRDRHAARTQHRGVRAALVDERVVARGEDRRRGEAAVVVGVDRRDPRIR